VTAQTIAQHFDLIAGTSTGGILAIGLGAGKTGREMRDLYMHRGPEIFPPVWDNVIGRAWKAVRNNLLNTALYRYSRQALDRVLQEFLGDRIFGESCVRLVIPAFDGRFSRGVPVQDSSPSRL
jgi:patatin-like phospholipase/acyl hydrolase